MYWQKVRSVSRCGPWGWGGYSVRKEGIATCTHFEHTYTLYLRIINYVCTKRKAHPDQEDSVPQVKHSIGQLELLCDVPHYR